MKRKNYAVYHFALVRILAALFKHAFCIIERPGHQSVWSREDAGTVRAHIQTLSDGDQRKLGKDSIDAITETECEAWPARVLHFLLVQAPGYVKDESGIPEAIQKAMNKYYEHILEKDMHHESLKSGKTVLQGLMDAISHSTKFGGTVLPPICEIQMEDSAEVDRLMDKIDGCYGTRKPTLNHSNRRKARIDYQTRIDRIRETLSTQEMDDYLVISTVGDGGQGVVYKALSKRDFGSLIAIKELDPEKKKKNVTLVERSQNEADILEKVSTLKKHDGRPHDNIVRYIDYSHKSCILFMEYIDGKSLEEELEWWYSSKRVEKLVRMPWYLTKDWILQLADGVALLHEREIIHRDLKPMNLMIDRTTNRLVIVDFGISKDFCANKSITMPGQTPGTPLYVSPEFVRSEPIVAASDVFSIAVIWHEMLTSYIPFEPAAISIIAPTEDDVRSHDLKPCMYNEALVKEKLKEDPRSLPFLVGLPKVIADIILKCTSAITSNRPQSAGELHEILVEAFKVLERSDVTHEIIPGYSAPPNSDKDPSKCGPPTEYGPALVGQQTVFGSPVQNLTVIYPLPVHVVDDDASRGEQSDDLDSDQGLFDDEVEGYYDVHQGDGESADRDYVHVEV